MITIFVIFWSPSNKHRDQYFYPHLIDVEMEAEKSGLRSPGSQVDRLGSHLSSSNARILPTTWGCAAAYFPAASVPLTPIGTECGCRTTPLRYSLILTLWGKSDLEEDQGAQGTWQ